MNMGMPAADHIFSSKAAADIAEKHEPGGFADPEFDDSDAAILTVQRVVRLEDSSNSENADRAEPVNTGLD